MKDDEKPDSKPKPRQKLTSKEQSQKESKPKRRSRKKQPKPSRELLMLAAQELQKRQRRRRLFSPKRLLHGPQLAFYEDPAKLKAANSGRRGGKSTEIAAELITAAQEFPNSYPLYITSAREEAKKIIWPAISKFDRECELGLEYKQNSGEVVFPNGSRILLQGAGSIREINKARGKKYPIVCIDEAQVFPKGLFDYMIDEVVEPATMDYDGKIVVTGTPNAACMGPFFDICNGKQPGWSVHSWTVKDNHHVFDDRPSFIDEHGGTFEAAIDWYLSNLRERRGWADDHPGYLREYMAQWVRDSSDTVFSIDRKHIYADRHWEPAQDTMNVVAIDVGYQAPMGFVVLGYTPSRGEVVQIEAFKEEHMIPTAAAVHVERLQEQYKPVETVVDTGGIGVGYQKQWAHMGIHTTAADKREKLAAIEFFNGDIRSGAFKVLPGCEEFLDEAQLIQWSPWKRAKGKFEFDKKFPDHLIDATLYGITACRHRGYRPKFIEGAQSQDEQYQALAAKMRKRALFPPKKKPWYQRIARG